MINWDGGGTWVRYAKNFEVASQNSDYTFFNVTTITSTTKYVFVSKSSKELFFLTFSSHIISSQWKKAEY